MKLPRKTWNACLLSCLACLMIALAALSVRSDSSAEAGVRKSATTPRHFKSGGQRSEALLSEILGTLNRIDGRLQRIEKLVTQRQNGQGRSSEEAPRRPR